MKIKDVVKEGIFTKTPKMSKTDQSVQHWVDKWKQQVAANRRLRDDPGQLHDYVARIVGNRIDSDDIPLPTDAEAKSPVATKEYIKNWVTQYHNVTAGDVYKPTAAPQQSAPTPGVGAFAQMAQQLQQPATPAGPAPAPGAAPAPTPAQGAYSVKNPYAVTPTPGAAPAPTAPRSKKQISVKDHADVVWIKDPHDQIWRSSETNDEVTDKAEIFKLEKAASDSGQYGPSMGYRAPGAA